jgi:O-succinylbenzoate synthase
MANLDPQQRRRAQFVRQAVSDAVRIDRAAWLQAAASLQPERSVDEVQIARLAASLTAVTPASLPPLGTLGLDALRQLLLDPAYQLK